MQCTIHTVAQKECICVVSVQTARHDRLVLQTFTTNRAHLRSARLSVRGQNVYILPDNIITWCMIFLIKHVWPAPNCTIQRYYYY